jgi:predicted O-methyltransferase YrrM
MQTLTAEGRLFDLVFADTWPGKYTNLTEALGLVAVGGLYVIDDMLPQPNWPEGHPAKVTTLVDRDHRRREAPMIPRPMSA